MHTHVYQQIFIHDRADASKRNNAHGHICIYVPHVIEARWMVSELLLLFNLPPCTTVEHYARAAVPCCALLLSPAASTYQAGVERVQTEATGHQGHHGTGGQHYCR